MSHNTRPLRRTIRSLALPLAFALALAAGSASADVLGPRVDDGGSGGSSTQSNTDDNLMIEQAGLVPTNGGPNSFSMGDDVPVLVGSTEEREEVANTDAQETASDTVEWPVLAGSGYEGGTDGALASSGILNETARSADLIAMSPTSSTEFAEAPGLAAR